jgi:hypothetical protein
MIDRLFAIGTGYLGWSAEQTMDTPMPQILLALDAKIEWTQSTNPFGGGKPKADKGQPQKPAQKLRAMYSAYGTRKVTRH